VISRPWPATRGVVTWFCQSGPLPAGFGRWAAWWLARAVRRWFGGFLAWGGACRITRVQRGWQGRPVWIPVVSGIGALFLDRRPLDRHSAWSSLASSGQLAGWGAVSRAESASRQSRLLMQAGVTCGEAVGPNSQPAPTTRSSSEIGVDQSHRQILKQRCWILPRKERLSDQWTVETWLAKSG